MADGAEFAGVHVGAAGEFEEAELELLLGQRFDGGVVGGFEVFAGGLVFGDLPGQGEVAEGANADLDV